MPDGTKKERRRPEIDARLCRSSNMTSAAKDRKAPVKRVLVLTSRTGGGHDARAMAFSKWIQELYGDRVEVRIDHTLEDSSPWNAFGVYLYNAIQRHQPAIHHLYYHLGELFGVLQRHRVSVGRPYFDRLLRDYRPDVVFSVHSILNRGYFDHAKRVLGDQVRCVTYCGEFKGSYGFSHNWVADQADLFLGRTTHTLESAKRLGLPAEKARCLSHLLDPVFYEDTLSRAEKEKLLVKELGLERDRFTLLLATGGAGAQNHVALLKSLLPFAGRMQVIVLCGRSPKAQGRLAAFRAANPELKVALLPYSDAMHKLLQVSSAIITRPGTTTCAEALQLGCPIIFNRIGGTMPQEFCTLRYFRLLDLSPEFRRASQLAARLRGWLERPERYADYLDRFRAARTDDDPRALIAAILGDPPIRAENPETREAIVEAALP